jgi:hypothetical protein
MVGAVGVIGALALAATLASVGGWMGPVNVALILAIFVAGIAAGGGRVAGAATGVAAAIAYNFFSTEPVHSLRVDHPRDIVTVGLLAVVGVVVGELGRRNLRSRWVASRSDIGLGRVVRVAELARNGTDPDTLVQEVEQAIRVELRLAEVRFEMGGLAGEDRTLIDGHGRLVESVHHFEGEGFSLPLEGADLAVTYRGRDFGRMVLRPQRAIGLPAEQIRCAVAITDQLGAALASMVP